jgi:hypothetical protein
MHSAQYGLRFKGIEGKFAYFSKWQNLAKFSGIFVEIMSKNILFVSWKTLETKISSKFLIPQKLNFDFWNIFE